MASILDLERLDAHPTSIEAFQKWLGRALKAVERWLEHEAGITEIDFDFCGAVANRASKLARRLGAGHLAAPHYPQWPHSQTIDLLGRMLHWCDQQAGSPVDSLLTVSQAARQLNIGERTVDRLLENDLIPFQRIGQGRGTKRIRPDDLQAYQDQLSKPAPKKAGPITLEHLRAV